jgi:hypothetical protein
MLLRPRRTDAFPRKPSPNASAKRLMNIQSDRGTRVLLKHLAAWGITLGMLTIVAMPAMANHIDTANVSLACDSYQICVSASELTPGTSYTITYEIIVTPSSGTPMTITIRFPLRLIRAGPSAPVSRRRSGP